MPAVVRIATTEQTTMKTGQRALDAVAGAEARREAGAGEEEAEQHRRDRDDEHGERAMRGPARQPRGGGGDLGGRLAEDRGRRRRCGSRRASRLCCAAVAPAVSASGRLRSSRPSMTLPCRSSQSSTRTSAGTPTQIATKAPW